MFYMGLDAHSRYCRLAVINDAGNVVRELDVITGEASLVDAIRQFRGPKKLAFEESTMAGWLNIILHPYVDEIVVAEPRENKLISGSERKSDRLDALRLAKLLRAGNLIKPVYHTLDQDRIRFKEVVQHYHDLTGEIRRIKSKIKAKFRKQGIRCKGSSVYKLEHREEWLSKLPDDDYRAIVQNLMQVMDFLTKRQKHASRLIQKWSRKFPEVKRFQQLPGVGPVIASTFVAFIITPHRFPDKKHLWSYCSLAVVRRTSDGKGCPPHLSDRGNRVLKSIAKQAVQGILHSKCNSLKSRYYALVNAGVKPENARLTLARTVLSIMYGMWKNGTDYRAEAC